MLQRFINEIRQDRQDIPEVRDIRSEGDHTFLETSKEHLDNLEIIRMKKLKTYNWRKKIAIPSAAILLPVLGYADYWLLFLTRSDDSGAGLSVAFMAGLYVWVTSPKRQYAKAYKEVILPELAKLFGDFKYLINGAIPVEEMRPSKIMPHHDKYETEDFFEGQYRGVNIKFSEVDFKQRRRSKNRTYYVSIFKGLAILLDLNTKIFYGHTIMDKDKSKISEWFKEKSSNLKRANLVDPEFEKLFDVYTNDQVEARYLIDPVMIERLKALQDEYNGEAMTAAFYDNKMLALIQSKHNHFEPADLLVPATDPRSILHMKNEIGEILSLIDRLELYDPVQLHEGKQVF